MEHSDLAFVEASVEQQEVLLDKRLLPNESTCSAGNVTTLSPEQVALHPEPSELLQFPSCIRRKAL